MADKRKQASWDYSDEGILTVVLPDGGTDKYDLTLLIGSWSALDEIQRFYIAYGVKQKLSDKCAATKDQTFTEVEKIARMKELYNFTVKERKLPKSEKDGGVKGPKAALGTVVKNGLEMGLTVDQIAMLTGKSAEVIARVIVELK